MSTAPFTNFAPQNQKTKAKKGLIDEEKLASTPEERDGECQKAFSYVKPKVFLKAEPLGIEK